MHITEAITTAARMGWRTRLVAAVLLIGPLPLTGDLELFALNAAGLVPGSTPCSASSSARPHDPPPQRGRPSDHRNHEHSLHDRNPAHHRRPGGPASSTASSAVARGAGPEPRALRPRRPPAAAGGRPRRGAGTSRPRRTWRPPNRTKRAGCTPSGSTSHGGASRDSGALVYSPGTGRAAVLALRGDGSWLEVLAVLGMRWRPGKTLSRAACEGSSPWQEAARDGRRRHRPGRPRRPQAPPPPRRGGGRGGHRASWQGARPPGRPAPSTRSARAASPFTATPSAGTASAAARAATWLDFIQRAEGLSLPEAIRRLDAAPPTLVRPSTSSRSAPPVVPPRDPALLTATGRFYGGELRRSCEARAYLASRGIRLETACTALAWATRPGAGCGGSLREPASARTASGTRVCSRSGASASPAWWSSPRSRGGRVRWLAGRAIDPERSPRFQSLPGPKPVLGMGRLGPAPSWAVVAEGLFDLARPGAVGPARLRRPGDARP